jgi:hypothetical protein
MQDLRNDTKYGVMVLHIETKYGVMVRYAVANAPYI